MDKQATLREKLIKQAVANPEKWDRLFPIIAALVEQGSTKAASTDKTAGLVKRIDRVKLTYTLNAFLEYLLGDSTDAIMRLRKLRLPSVMTDGYAGVGSALWTELYERWMLVAVRTLMKYKGVEEVAFDEMGAERVPVMASDERELRKELLKLAVAQPELRKELMPLIKTATKDALAK